ncbi:MAG TPA: hypothetical protein VGS19_05515 [Streptosporangiaceae bacterium]|nr:hypothetical protein [Streptosporangiaceae bacterium]
MRSARSYSRMTRRRVAIAAAGAAVLTAVMAFGASLPAHADSTGNSGSPGNTGNSGGNSGGSPGNTGVIPGNT